ncbi:MAG: hypothetical protein EAZ15_05095 [Sphingobacteriales bacterium]|nr:MAG: hypothetical protein EAZ15_05095 [Sphingobacteriales bacterium]
MKKIIFNLILLCSISNVLFAQQWDLPPILLGKSQEFVKKYAIDSIGVEFIESKYSNIGNPFLASILKFSLITETGSLNNSAFSAFYSFTTTDKCARCSYSFLNKNDIKNIVDILSKNNHYVRNEGEFSWQSVDYGYTAVINNAQETGFTLTYEFRRPKKE